MPSMELGALKDMPDIRKKASLKLFKQQVYASFHLSSIVFALPFPFQLNHVDRFFNLRTRKRLLFCSLSFMTCFVSA